MNLTQLTTNSDLVVKEYLAAIPAYQTVYLADGRPFTSDISTTGYHKIDMNNTAVTGTITPATPKNTPARLSRIRTFPRRPAPTARRSDATRTRSATRR